MIKHALTDEALRFFLQFQSDHWAAEGLEQLRALATVADLESPAGRRYLDSRIQVQVSRYALQLLMTFVEGESYSLTFWIFNKYVEFEVTEEPVDSKALLLDDECKFIRNDTKIPLLAYGEDSKAVRAYVPRPSQLLDHRRDIDTEKRQLVAKEHLPSVCFHTLLNVPYAILSADVSEEGGLLLCSFEDGSIKLWDMSQPIVSTRKTFFETAKQREYRSFYGHSGAVFAVKFSPCNRSFISAGEDGTIRLWSLITFSTVTVLKGHSFPVWTLSFCLQGVYFASGGADQTARLWATDCSQNLRIFVGHLSDVSSVRFHPSGLYLASASVDKTIRLWQLMSADCVRILSNHCYAVTALEFSYSGKVLFSSDDSGKVTAWSLPDGRVLWEHSTNASSTTSLNISHNDAVLAVSSEDCLVSLLDPATGRKLVVCATKDSPVLTASFTWRDLLLAVGVYRGAC